MTTEELSDDELDPPGSLDELETEECWRLLATTQVGRIGVIVGHYPLIFPVNYALDGRRIVFRSGAGTKLWAIAHSNVTFQVDEIDPVHRSGWSVMVRGAAREINTLHDPEAAARSRLAGAVPWAPGNRDRLVWVVTDHISGRRIRPAELPSAFDARGYV